MSKIYEALNRAELERGESLDSIAQRFAAIRLPKSPTPIQGLAEGAAKRSANKRDLESISSVAWHPNLKSLPSLQERGRALEQFRSLRSHLREMRDLGELKSVLVSSGLPQEGKSFVSANLAISLSRYKSASVLLIDGDMRRSSLPKLFGCPKTPGLTDYLSGQASFLEVMQRPKVEDARVQAGLNSLYFIPAGSDAENAADLSGSPRFPELLAAAADIFDWIIVDSSPVNLVSDGVNLARCCHGALLVARGGRTEYSMAQKAMAELKSSRVIGIVLNAVDNAPFTNSYYGYDPEPIKA